MVALSHLWLPIIVSAVAVFLVSALLHMLFTYHNSDYRQFSNEDDVRAAITKGGATPGQYVLPYAMGMGYKDPVVQQKMKEGPAGFVLLRKPSGPEMGPALTQWFVLTLVLSCLVAYVAALTLAPGTDHMAVFRVVSVTAFLAYAGTAAQESIWRAVPWPAGIKVIFDGLVFALVTGGLFAVMWPAQ
jgi:hypothetical protein